MKNHILTLAFIVCLTALSFTSVCAQAKDSLQNKENSLGNVIETAIINNNIVSESLNNNRIETEPSDIRKETPKKDSAKKKNLTYGIASFYAKYFEGMLTATGEIFHHTNLTAASNNFKLNTWVRVINLLNGKSIIVRINDRMHPRMAAKGRVVDLTVTAAKLLNFTKAGTAKVRVEVVQKGTKE
ncbi:MAG: septal ring lytic transglycosylase RlpA family protein [Parafilimonas sp.]